MFSWISRLLIACVFTGCSYKKDQPKPNETETLFLNIPSDPISFDPHVVRSLKDITIMKQLYDGLMRLDERGQPCPAIAQDVTISKDGLTYTFTLRDACWDNGDPVYAHDFFYAWMKVLDPNFPADYAYLLYPIKNAKLIREGKCSPDEIGLQVIDDKTLVVSLESPTPYFLELTAFPIYFPENRHIGFSSTNGPFQLKTWLPNQELVLKKNLTYWDHKAVQLDEIHFSIIADCTTESYLFEKGELDWLGSPISNALPVEIVEKKKREGLLDSQPVAGTFFLKCNTEAMPFSEPLIRRAFASAIDRREIIDHILQGGQTVATGLLPPLMSLQKDPYFEDASPNLAMKFFEDGLHEQGWTRDSFPHVILNYTPSERNHKIAQLIQFQFKKHLGIDIVLECLEKQVAQAKMKQGNFQIAMADWFADFHDPISFLELFKYRNDSAAGSGMNETRWHNETYTTLLDLSLKESNAERRSELLHRAESVLIEDLPVIPIYHYAFDYLKNEKVQNVIISPLGTADFKWAVIR